MATRTQFILTTGVSGSGKTYRRCAHYLVKEFLPFHSGVHISNFPVKLDALQEYCNRHGIKCNVQDRVKVISSEELTKWLNGESGPWEYFKDEDLSGVHLALDEAHNFCSKKSKPYIRERWARWLGELRHQGMTAEFLTQNEANMANEVMNQCEIRLEIVNGENRIDPIMHIRMSDWYEFKAKFTGKYIAPSYELEYMQMKGRWKVQNEVKFYRESELFELYDSFNKPVQSDNKGESEKRHYERMGWIRFLLWFFGTNFPPFLRLFIIVSIFVWLLFFGGVGQVMRLITNGSTKLLNKKDNAIVNKSSQILKSNEIYSNGNSNGSQIIYFEDFYNSTNKKIVCVTENIIKLDDGTKIEVGDDILGFKIISIDIRRRKVLFDDLGVIDISELANYF